MNLAPSAGAVRRAYQEELGPGQRSALLSWLAFTGTFAGLRGLTNSIRAGKGPGRNISIGGEHLHHHMWGIGILSGVGVGVGVGVVAVSCGSGLALIVDEFALLLDLRDDYWAKQGRISIDIDVDGNRPDRVLLRGTGGTPQAATGEEAGARVGTRCRDAACTLAGARARSRPTRTPPRSSGEDRNPERCLWYG